jgi:hypothetical protein
METFCVIELPCAGQDKRDIMYITVHVRSQQASRFESRIFKHEANALTWWNQTARLYTDTVD